MRPALAAPQRPVVPENMAVHVDIGTLLVEADKAPEGWSSPRRFAFTLAVEHRASVLDCGSPLPLFPVAGQTVPMLIKTAMAVHVKLPHASSRRQSSRGLEHSRTLRDFQSSSCRAERLG